MYFIHSIKTMICCICLMFSYNNTTKKLLVIVWGKMEIENRIFNFDQSQIHFTKIYWWWEDLFRVVFCLSPSAAETGFMTKGNSHPLLSDDKPVSQQESLCVHSYQIVTCLIPLATIVVTLFLTPEISWSVGLILNSLFKF